MEENMRKLSGYSLFVAGCIAAAMYTGCGSDSSSNADENATSEISSESNYSSSSFNGTQLSSAVNETSSSSVDEPLSSAEEDNISSSSYKEPSSSSLEHYAWQFLNEKLSYGEMVDERDGQVYKTIKIGELTWMAENLNYNNHGYYRHEEGLGYFYYGYASRDYIDTLCPTGWRIPTYEEWKSIISSDKDPLAANAWRLKGEDSTKFSNNDNSLGLTILPGGRVIGSWKYDYEDDEQSAEFFSSKFDSTWDYSNGGYVHAVRYFYVSSSTSQDGSYYMQSHSMPLFRQAFFVRCVNDPEGYDFITYYRDELDSLTCDEANAGKTAYDAENYKKRVCELKNEADNTSWFWNAYTIEQTEITGDNNNSSSSTVDDIESSSDVTDGGACDAMDKNDVSTWHFIGKDAFGDDVEYTYSVNADDDLVLSTKGVNGSNEKVVAHNMSKAAYAEMAFSAAKSTCESVGGNERQ